MARTPLIMSFPLLKQTHLTDDRRPRVRLGVARRAKFGRLLGAGLADSWARERGQEFGASCVPGTPGSLHKAGPCGSKAARVRRQRLLVRGFDAPSNRPGSAPLGRH